jgi:hypothetical protein
MRGVNFSRKFKNQFKNSPCGCVVYIFASSPLATEEVEATGRIPQGYRVVGKNAILIFSKIFSF